MNWKAIGELSLFGLAMVSRPALAGPVIGVVSGALIGLLGLVARKLLGGRPATVRRGSDWGQTGVKPGSDWGQTGVRPRWAHVVIVEILDCRQRLNICDTAASLLRKRSVFRIRSNGAVHESVNLWLDRGGFRRQGCSGTSWPEETGE